MSRRSRSSPPRSGTRSSRSTCPRPSTPRGGAARACAGKGWGRIINIASAHGLVASPFKSAYVAAKHGVLGLTKIVALETAEDGITCNAICPGYVRTPLVEKQIDDQAKAHGIARDEVIARRPAEAAADQAVRRRRRTGRAGACSCAATGGLDHRHRAAHRRRLDRALREATMDGARSRLARRARATTSSASTSPCRAAARTAPSPGACSIACSRTSGSRSRRSAGLRPVR